MTHHRMCDIFPLWHHVVFFNTLDFRILGIECPTCNNFFKDMYYTVHVRDGTIDSFPCTICIQLLTSLLGESVWAVLYVGVMKPLWIGWAGSGFQKPQNPHVDTSYLIYPVQKEEATTPAFHFDRLKLWQEKTHKSPSNWIDTPQQKRDLLSGHCME